jgi:hypothetical protein
MNQVNLQEIKDSMEKGVIVSRPAWVAVVERALVLEDQRHLMARLIVEKLKPRFVAGTTGVWQCQCCTVEVIAGPDEAPEMTHDRGCEYVEAYRAYEAATVQHSGNRAFRIDASAVLAKNRWDSESVEARFHKRIVFLTKREQGKVMGAFRDAIKEAQESQS